MPTESRTITLHFDAVRLTHFKLACGGPETEAALGYLSQWNYTFPHVDIYMARDDELTACYRAEGAAAGDRPGYVIGAIFNHEAKSFSFHS